jgi:hypothetical protein
MRGSCTLTHNSGAELQKFIQVVHILLKRWKTQGEGRPSCLADETV